MERAVCCPLAPSLLIQDAVSNGRRSRTAFSHLDSRIAPVFDTASELRVCEFADGQLVNETRETILEDLPIQKVLRLAELGVETLVCGAISRPLEGLITAYGIKVVPFLAGELQEVVDAWQSPMFSRRAFMMPGLWTPRHRAPRRRHAKGETDEW